MTDFDTLPDPEAEQSIYNQMRAYDQTERMSYAQIGLMALAVARRLLWKYRTDPADGMPCRSFARYIHICCPYAYSTVYSALRDVEELADIPAGDLAQIPMSNFPTMKQLSTKVRHEPAMLEAAKTQRTEQFIATIRKAHPDQHVEPKRLMRFTPAESAAAFINSVLEEALEHGAANRDDALELMAQEAHEAWRREPIEAIHEIYPEQDTQRPQ